MHDQAVHLETRRKAVTAAASDLARTSSRRLVTPVRTSRAITPPPRARRVGRNDVVQLRRPLLGLIAVSIAAGVLVAVAFVDAATIVPRLNGVTFHERPTWWASTILAWMTIGVAVFLVRGRARRGWNRAMGELTAVVNVAVAVAGWAYGLPVVIAVAHLVLAMFILVLGLRRTEPSRSAP